MATFTVNNASNRFTLRLTVTETATSITENTSTLSYLLELVANTSYHFSDYSIGRSVAINGSTVYNVSRADSAYLSIGSNGTLTLASGSGVVVPHNADGTKTISVAFSIDMSSESYTPGPLSGTGSMTLTTIPRASGVTCTQAEIGTAAVIVIARYADAFTHTLTYTFGSLSGTIATKTNQTTIAWTIPTSFYAQIPAAKTGTGTLTCQTYSGDTLIGTSSYTLTVTTSAAACAPIVSLAVIDVNAASIALTGDSSKLIRYASNPRATVTATARNSASIAGTSIACSDGQSATASPVTFSGAAGSLFTATVTDSRGYSTTVSVTLSMVQYIPLTLSASFRRPAPTTGEIVCSFSGNYFNGSFGNVANTLALSWAYRIKGATSWTSGGTFAAGTKYTISGSTFSSTGEISLGTVFDYQNNYEFILYYADRLTNTGVGPIPVSKGIPVYNWGEEFFNVNGMLKVKEVAVCGIAVGDILFSTLAENPSTRYPGTDWAAWGAGRVPVGVDTSQTEFNTVEKTAGEKSHVLQSNELPSHSHSFSATTNTTGAHTHTTPGRLNSTTSGSLVTEAWSSRPADANVPSSSTGNHAHTVSGTTGNSGGGALHNNLQPYITCYMWKRTA